MRAHLLHVFACYANPLRWRSRLENFRRFEHHILAGGLPLTTVECGYGQRDWDLPDRPGVRRVRVRARDLLWHKENLLGLAGQHTPDWEYAATVDGDIHFVDPGWPVDTLHALQLHNTDFRKFLDTSVTSASGPGSKARHLLSGRIRSPGDRAE
jgi:hypothetical protein